jgi:hypothetical protein
MNDNNIYIVEAEGTTLRRFVSAASSTAARAAISRIVIKVRRAKPAELLGVNQAAVIDAETGLPLDIVVRPEDQALATGNTDAAEA